MFTTTKAVSFVLLVLFLVPALFAQVDTRHCVPASSDGPMQALLDDGRPMSLLPFLQHKDGSTINPSEYRSLSDECYYLSLEAKPDMAKFAEALQADQKADQSGASTAKKAAYAPIDSSAEAGVSDSQNCAVAEKFAAPSNDDLLIESAEVLRLRDLVNRVVLQNQSLTVQNSALIQAAAEKDKFLQTNMDMLKETIDTLNLAVQKNKWNVSLAWPVFVAIAFCIGIFFRERQWHERMYVLHTVKNNLAEARRERDNFEAARDRDRLQLESMNRNLNDTSFLIKKLRELGVDLPVLRPLS